MATVKTWSQLEKALRQIANEALKETGEKVAEEVVKDEIQKEVYDKYLDGGYDRTGEFKESIKITDQQSNGNISTVEIGHDTNTITHTSWVDGSSVGESLPEIIHNGLTGAMMPDYKYWKESPKYISRHTFAIARPYMDVAKVRLVRGKEHVKFMRESLKKMGIDTK